jgi:RNA polymerase sigma-70 factor (ECF subfamily)
MQMNASPVESEEYTLAVRARDGDRDALGELVTRLRGPLFAVAFAELGHYEDACDAVADAVLRICRNIGGLRDPAQARAWMLRIARNEARRRRPLPSPVAEPEAVSVSSVPPSLLRLDVERALRSLPADMASAVALFYLDGLSVAEIAARLGRPAGTVKYWLHRGRVHLNHSLEGYAPMTTPDTLIVPASAPLPEAQGDAAIVSSEIPAERLREMTEEIRAAGWRNIRHLSDPTVLGRGADGRLPDALTGCRLIVLDEFVGGRSAFELAVLWRATQEGWNTPILLLIAGRDRPEETENTVLAAYLAGFDMLLTKPYAPGEIESFTRRIRQVQAEMAV